MAFCLCPSPEILNARKSGSVSVFRWAGSLRNSCLIHWTLRLALSKGTNRVGVSFPSPEDGNRSSFQLPEPFNSVNCSCQKTATIYRSKMICIVSGAVLCNINAIATFNGSKSAVWNWYFTQCLQDRNTKNLILLEECRLLGCNDVCLFY
jgi:hypothetical protein